MPSIDREDFNTFDAAAWWDNGDKLRGRQYLEFDSQPTGAGVPFAIHVLNRDGSLDTSSTAVITVHAQELSVLGTTSVAAIAGIATFTDIAFPEVIANVRLIATSPNIVYRYSDPFTTYLP